LQTKNGVELQNAQGVETGEGVALDALQFIVADDPVE